MPLDVVDGVLLDVFGVVVVVFVVVVRVALLPELEPVRVGVDAAPFGTSFSCGCAALSRFASARSRFNDVSTASESLALSFVVHAPAAKASASTGTKERIYFVVIVSVLERKKRGACAVSGS